MKKSALKFTDEQTDRKKGLRKIQQNADVTDSNQSINWNHIFDSEAFLSPSLDRARRATFAITRAKSLQTEVEIEELPSISYNSNDPASILEMIKAVLNDENGDNYVIGVLGRVKLNVSSNS